MEHQIKDVTYLIDDYIFTFLLFYCLVKGFYLNHCLSTVLFAFSSLDSIQSEDGSHLIFL